MNVTVDGIVIVLNDEQPQKAFDPIIVTDGGITIVFNDEHP